MNDTKAAKRLNVLLLTAGGVRDLSSLLILQALMVEINQSLASLDAPPSELHPQHIFQLAAGTSTGGLIALMLGKMGMTVNECITQYEEFSKKIFGRRRLRGRITHGLAPALYSGTVLRNCVRKLLSDRQFDEDLSMKNEADAMACAVICREHCSPHRYSKLKQEAVPICSLPCDVSIVCKVCDAARATSAAPTFFSVMKIQDRFFTDGGLGHNNPSFVIWYHYGGSKRQKSTRQRPAPPFAPRFSRHGDLDCSRVRFTNIGTGAKLDDAEPRRRKRLTAWLPTAVKHMIFLSQSTIDIAVSSEKEAGIMQSFQSIIDEDVFVFERFSANHGLSNIKLDAYNALQDIRLKTGQYLEEQETKTLLQEVGIAIAKDYISNQAGPAKDTQAVNAAIGEPHQPIDPLQVTPGSSSPSSAPPNHNGHMENGIQGLLPYHDEVRDGGQTALTKHQAENFLSPGGQRHCLHDAQEDSDIDTTGPEI